jgi:hypothetical protein
MRYSADFSIQTEYQTIGFYDILPITIFQWQKIESPGCKP